MNLRTFACAVAASALATAALAAAPPIELELATERGVQITAPHEWLQLLADLGLQSVRIRGATSADKPQLVNRGSETAPSYHVVGVLTARNELQLPGGTFQARDVGRLRDYFERLSADGAEGVTAPRGRFGLTEAQFAAAHADLAQSIDFATKDRMPREVLDRLQAKFALRLVPDAEADAILRNARAVNDNVEGLTAGTGLAIVLRRLGLTLRPEKTRGQPVVHRVALLETVDDGWPVGWEPEQPPSRIAPALMEFVNAEIDGYTLAETFEVLGPRIKLPLYWDHAALAAHQIDPAAVQVRLAPTRTFYKRILDRALAQAHLTGQLRVDEAGTAFLWITR